MADPLPYELDLPDGRTLRTRIPHPPDRTDHGASLFAHIEAVPAQGDREVHEYGGSESGVGSRARSRRARRDRSGVAFMREQAMTEDWFLAAVDRVADAGREACEAIAAAVEALEASRGARLAGRPLAEIVDDLIAVGGREVRLGTADAFRQYERSIASMRAAVVRALVDENGLSLTEASQRLKISRQAAARLYQTVTGESDEGSD
ncbi:MAG: hypothetical protein QOE80_1730 [Actinomycetota bacterium]|nr:hypothetical protein [Actinomycetota bacterium]